MAVETGRSEEQGRCKLAECIPIDTPFVVGFFTGDICNFKCKYCLQSAKDERLYTKDGMLLERQLVEKFMEWDTFVVAANQLGEFPKKIKKILFSSIGEPLLHKDLPKMIHYLDSLAVADAYEIVTNAAVLNPELSRNIIDAGLTRLCVSIQGMSSQKYKEISQVDIDFDHLVKELAYFYNYSRGKCQVHIKTVDIALDEGEKKEFYDIFSPICDTIHVDHVVEAFQGIDYSNMVDSRNGIYDEQKYRKVCPNVFYTMYVLPDGGVVTCCDPPYPICLGNVHKTTLDKLWNSDKRIRFLKMQLEGKRNQHAICKNCVQPIMTTFSEDNLDDVAQEIISRL